MVPVPPSQQPGVARDASSIVAILAELRTDGFAADFVPEEGGRVSCPSCRRSSPAERCEVFALWRLEGASDPDEMAVVVALACPQCRRRGVFVLTYGPAITAVDEAVLQRLPTTR